MTADEARADEREQLALLAELHAVQFRAERNHGAAMFAERCAALIRQLGRERESILLATVLDAATAGATDAVENTAPDGIK